MARKKIASVSYFHNPNIVTYEELPFGKDVIKPGDNIKVKGVRGTFKVHKFVHHQDKGVQWVDCMDNLTGEFRSFYLERIKLVIRPKKARRKKIVQGT